MCIRDGRDERGRFAVGTSGNPKGRRPATAYARLLSAASRVGAQVVVMVPPETVADEPPPVPPVAA